MRPLSPEEAYNKVASHCSVREQCEADIRTKLRRWELSSRDIEQIISRLKEEHFLSESRYIRAFIHDKLLYEHWGRVKILAALRLKKISEGEIRRHMDEVIDEETYQDILLSLLRVKLKSLSLPLSFTDRARLYRFALQRGFESSFISHALALLSISDEGLSDDAFFDADFPADGLSD